MPPILNATALGMALALGIGLSGTALAQGTGHGRGYDHRGHGHHGYEHYGAASSYGGDYAYAGAAIRGDYVGAPFTRFPRPSELVPSAWGYGTYGIPTVTGIRPASVGTPTVYVIDSPVPVARRMRSAVPGREGRWSQAQPAARMASGLVGARVVSVTVPRTVPPRRTASR